MPVTNGKVITSVVNSDGVSGSKFIEVNGGYFTVLENIRKTAGDFKAKYHCHMCDPNKEKFNPKLLILPGYNDYLVCRTCICNLEEVLKAAQLYDCEKGERN